jgi:UDP-2,3-diacylglucosamine hydrolase
MLNISNSDIIFAIADTHFHNKSRNSDINDFFLFLKKVRQEADKLFLLGDIFDFYFEYKTVIPKSLFRVFCELYKTKSAGVEIHYWVGNHDFYLGQFIKDIGIVPHSLPEVISASGAQILIEHGNEINSPDMLGIILKNRLSRALFSIIHPDLGITLARKVSRLSRLRSGKTTLDLNYLARYAHRKFSSGIDAIMMGHFHKPYLYEDNNKSLVILGDWSNYRSFGIIRDGRISLRRFNHSPR